MGDGHGGAYGGRPVIGVPRRRRALVAGILVVAGAVYADVSWPWQLAVLATGSLAALAYLLHPVADPRRARRSPFVVGAPGIVLETEAGRRTFHWETVEAVLLARSTTMVRGIRTGRTEAGVRLRGRTGPQEVRFAFQDWDLDHDRLAAALARFAPAAIPIEAPAGPSRPLVRLPEPADWAQYLTTDETAYVRRPRAPHAGPWFAVAVLGSAAAGALAMWAQDAGSLVLGLVAAIPLLVWRAKVRASAFLAIDRPGVFLGRPRGPDGPEPPMLLPWHRIEEVAVTTLAGPGRQRRPALGVVVTRLADGARVELLQPAGGRYRFNLDRVGWAVQNHSPRKPVVSRPPLEGTGIRGSA